MIRQTSSSMFQTHLTVIGLKTDETIDGEFDDVFSDSDEEVPIIQPRLQIRKQNSNSLTMNMSSNYKYVTDFNDANSVLTPICAILQKYLPPLPFSDKICFISADSAPVELVEALEKFEMTKDSDDFEEISKALDYTVIPNTIYAQVQIIRSIYNEEVDLHTFLVSVHDTRITSLVDWILATKSSGIEECSLYINCLLNFVKEKTVAPISKLFNEFTFPNIINQVCKTMCELFPKHPILPSVVHKLKSFLPDSVPEFEEGEKKELINEFDDDESDDFDDFDDLLEIQRSKSENSPSLLSLNVFTISNPLECLSHAKIEIQQYPETPQLLTYNWIKGPQINPDDFISWMEELRSTSEQRTLPTGYKFDPMNFSPLYTALSFLEPVNLIRKEMTPQLFSMFLPIYHHVNSNRELPFIVNATFPELLKIEHQMHISFYTNKEMPTDTIQKLSDLCNNLETIPITASATKRYIPPPSLEFTEDMLFVSYLIDIIIYFDGRSVLTLAPVTRATIAPGMLNQFPLVRQKTIVDAIFKIYSETNLPPYLAFRAAFAIGVSLANTRAMPKKILASRFLFEAVYVLLGTFPSLKSSIWAKSVFFALGNTLASTGKYFYCAVAYDNALLLSKKDNFFLAHAASVSAKNNDTIRAVFFYTRAIGLYLQRSSHDINSAIYIAKNLAPLYQNNNQYYECIRFLEAVVNLIYPSQESTTTHGAIPLKKIKEGSSTLRVMTNRQNQIYRQRSFGQDCTGIDMTSADNINAIRLVHDLVKNLLKLGQTATAFRYVKRIDEVVKNTSIKRIMQFLRAKINYEQNKMKDSTNDLASINFLIELKRVTNQIIEVTFPSIKILINSYLDREVSFKALYYAEILCTQSSSKREVADGYYLRGNAFNQLITRYTTVANIPLDEEIDPMQVSLPGFKKPVEKWTLEGFLKEALSSYHQAAVLFEQIGNPYKNYKSRVAFLELLCRYLVMIKVFNLPQFSKLNLEAPYFQLDGSTATNFDGQDLQFDSATIIDNLSSRVQALNTMATDFIEPILNINLQVINAEILLLKNKEADAVTYYSFALQNLNNLFFDGHKFILNDVHIHFINQVLYLMRRMTLLLLQFPPIFLNNQLIVFDMLNNLTALQRNNITRPVNEIHLHIEPSVDIFPTIEDLRNPAYPDFIPTLEVMIKQRFPSRQEPVVQLNYQLEIRTIYRMMHLNLHLQSSGEISMTELTQRNLKCVADIGDIASEIRSKSQTESKKQASKYTAFVFILYGHIVSYIPSTQAKKFTKLESGKTAKTIQVKNLSQQFKFHCNESFIHANFAEQISSLIVSGAQITQKVSLDSEFHQRCIKLGLLIFGSPPFLKSLKTEVIPDNHSFEYGKKPKKRPPGHLYTLSITSNPFIIISSVDTNFLPFELMFPSICVIRSVSYHMPFSPKKKEIVKDVPTIFLSSKDSCARSQNIVMRCMMSVGLTSARNTLRNMDKTHPFQFPLLDRPKTAKDFPFCQIIQLPHDSPVVIENKDITCVILTYADLAEWPIFVENLMAKYPLASYYFIPAAQIPAAFQKMNKIVKRHQKREEYFSTLKEKDDAKAPNMELLQNRFQYAATIQITLQNKLGVPIALILPDQALF